MPGVSGAGSPIRHVKWLPPMKTSICIALIACLFGGCATDRDPAHYDAEAARSRIHAALPAHWGLVQQDRLQTPTTERYFAGPGNEAFMLVGPQLIYCDLNDRAGRTHREYLWQECLHVWVVRGDFEPRFERTTIYNFFDPPWHSHPVFASCDVKIYADLSGHIIDTNRVDQLIREAYGFSSQPVRLSWKSWRHDIAASLKQ
jgi:hypothetical protein